MAIRRKCLSLLKALDQVAFTIKYLAEAGFPFAIGFARDVGNRALRLDQIADAIGVISLVGQNDGARIETIKQAKRGGAVMGLAGGQAEPDREPLGIDDRVDLGREAAPRATETMISIPLFFVADCWWARTEVLSIIWMSPSWAAVMASIIRSHTPAFRHLTKRL